MSVAGLIMIAGATGDVGHILLPLLGEMLGAAAGTLVVARAAKTAREKRGASPFPPEVRQDR